MQVGASKRFKISDSEQKNESDRQRKQGTRNSKRTNHYWLLNSWVMPRGGACTKKKIEASPETVARKRSCGIREQSKESLCDECHAWPRQTSKSHVAFGNSDLIQWWEIREERRHGKHCWQVKMLVASKKSSHWTAGVHAVVSGGEFSACEETVMWWRLEQSWCQWWRK